MAVRIRLTRPELKRQRDALARFTRFLPMLKLKQQQLQSMIGDIRQKLDAQRVRRDEARRTFDRYRRVLADPAGVHVEERARPREVRTRTSNIAGVRIPVLEEVVFEPVSYSLFATPPWVDRAMAELRSINRLGAEIDVLEQEHAMLHAELTKVTQRVNLFEKVKIPEAREAIRRIRIRLGDEMTAGVGRAKIAKAKLAEEQSAIYPVETMLMEPHGEEAGP